MASLRQLSSCRQDLFMLNPDLISEEEGWNVRVECEDLDTHIRQLADSIKEIGVQQPLTVYMKGEEAVATDGHCRLRAVRLARSEGADIQTVPVRAEARYANDADRVLSLLTRNSGRPLSIPEQADVVKKLLNFGWKEAEIAKKIGVSRQHIYSVVKFVSMPEEMKKLVNTGKVSPTVAIDQFAQDSENCVKNIKDASDRIGKKKVTKKHLAGKTYSIKVAKSLLNRAIEIIGDSEFTTEVKDFLD